MSDTLQTSTLIQLASLYSDEIVSQINRHTVLLGLLDARLGRNSAGPQWVARSPGVNVDVGYAEGADLSSFESDAQTSASLGWCLLRSTFHVSDQAMSRARFDTNPAGNTDLWVQNEIYGCEKLGKSIEENLFLSQGGANPMVDLRTAVDDSTTYAGISKVSNSWWAGNSFSQSGSLSVADVRGDLAYIANRCGERPKYALVNPRVMSTVLEVFNSSRQFNTFTNITGQNTLGDRLLPVAAIDGCLFIGAPDGYIDTNNDVGDIVYVNDFGSSPEAVHLEYMPYTGIDGITSGPAPALPGSPLFGAQDQNVPLGFDFYLAAKVGDSQKAAVRAQLQLVVPSPFRCGIRTGVPLT